MMEKFRFTNKAEDFFTDYKLYASGELRVQSQGMSKGKWICQDEIRLTPNQVREVAAIYRKHIESREGKIEETRWQKIIKTIKKKVQKE